MSRAKLSIDATRPPGDQERAPVSGVAPAPLCDGTSSLWLDQTGQRVERTRKRLQRAGILCLCLLWLMVEIVGVTNGGGGDDDDEILIPLLTMAGLAIVGVLLLLAGLLLGRLTSAWWHPRMGETALTSCSGEGRSVQSSSAQIDRAREAKRHYRMAKRVRRQIREARIFDRRLDGGGTLLTEPILVLHGQPGRDLAIFDQEGNQLGSAVRMRDPTSASPGSAWLSEVRDSQGRSVLTIRLAARRRWAKCAPTKTGTYAVCSPDGREIANIGQVTKRASRTVTAGGIDAIARLDGGPAMSISDTEGRQIAHITSNHAWHDNHPWYVLNYKAPVDEPLRRLVLAASIVWDDEVRESTS